MFIERAPLTAGAIEENLRGLNGGVVGIDVVRFLASPEARKFLRVAQS
jgi:hypothetical protein